MFKKLRSFKLSDEYVRGAKRTYYSARLIAIVVATSLFTAAITGMMTTWIVTKNTNNTIYNGAVAGCERSNDVRRESNRRIPSHILDRNNLQSLAAHLATNRSHEAAAFSAINGLIESFGPSPIVGRVDELVKTLRQASEDDQAIADSEKTVFFSNLPIIPCNDTKYVPKP